MLGSEAWSLHQYRRGIKGLPQTQLAGLLDTTRKMIDYYDRRAGNPSLDFIQRATEALDVSVAELLGQWEILLSLI